MPELQPQQLESDSTLAAGAGASASEAHEDDPSLGADEQSVPSSVPPPTPPSADAAAEPVPAGGDYESSAPSEPAEPIPELPEDLKALRQLKAFLPEPSVPEQAKTEDALADQYAQIVREVNQLPADQFLKNLTQSLDPTLKNLDSILKQEWYATLENDDYKKKIRNFIQLRMLLGYYQSCDAESLLKSTEAAEESADATKEEIKKRLKVRNQILDHRSQAKANSAAEFFVPGTTSKRGPTQNQPDLIKYIRASGIEINEGLYLFKDKKSKCFVYCDGEYTKENIERTLDYLYDQNPVTFYNLTQKERDLAEIEALKRGVTPTFAHTPTQPYHKRQTALGILFNPFLAVEQFKLRAKISQQPAPSVLADLYTNHGKDWEKVTEVILSNQPCTANECKQLNQILAITADDFQVSQEIANKIVNGMANDHKQLDKILAATADNPRANEAIITCLLKNAPDPSQAQQPPLAPAQGGDVAIDIPPQSEQLEKLLQDSNDIELQPILAGAPKPPKPPEITKAKSIGASLAKFENLNESSLAKALLAKFELLPQSKAGQAQAEEKQVTADKIAQLTALIKQFSRTKRRRLLKKIKLVAPSCYSAITQQLKQAEAEAQEKNVGLAHQLP